MRCFAYGLVLLLLIAPPLAAQTTGDAAAPAAPSPAPAQDTAAELVRLLENDEARAALIARLRQGAAAPAADATAAEPALVRQIAERSRAIAEGAAAGLSSVARTLSEVGSGALNLGRPGLAALGDLALGVALVALGLAVSYLLLRAAVKRSRRWLALRAAGRGWVGRTLGLAGGMLFDALAVLLAWGAGYALALQVVGGATGRMGIGQSLLLNAFLMVEAAKLVLRAALSPRQPILRPVPLNDEAAAYWFLWLKRLVSLLGYAFLFAAPVLATTSLAAAEALRVVVMAMALVIAVLLVLQNRAPVRAALTARAAQGRQDMLSRTLSLLGQVWHGLAIFYLVALFAVWLVNPREALSFMVGATAESALAILAGGLVLFLIRRAVHLSVRVPADLAERLPLLEGRLRAFVPRVMQAVRTVVLVCIAALIAQAWGLVDFLGWLASEGGQRVAGSLLSAGLIVVVGIAIYIAVSSWVEYRLNPHYGTAPTPRERTLLSLFRNAFTIALCVLVLMLALAQIGVNIAPLLAGAGVLGLAIGFGAQKLVQDIITGAFIQLENIMNEGDVVAVGGTSGVVERLTIRSVSIRDLSGTLHLIPFSSVDKVSNMMKGFSFHVAEIGVAYRENIDEVKAAMQEAFDQLAQSAHGAGILGPLDMQGLVQFGDSAVVVRARIKTLPGKHWVIGRAYNEIIKQVFDARGIEIPFPHLTLYMGQDKQGAAPPLPVEVTPVRPKARLAPVPGR
ncbi:mechanosensitive ion channel domain-containing protein [Teichococcus vastitatis]|uniref:mechanosensitive ion channel domain-containing protein n=1 Tax=Teichococcus vastitatis TaxID=2307076 RepID=UPI000E725F60|nr:mechanosensitive ion channel domain-containing protein [Pseudoroseomonas vastitatis]